MHLVFFFLQSQRPSIYQKMTMPADPLKEALKALENTCLSAKSKFFYFIIIKILSWKILMLLSYLYSFTPVTLMK